MSNTKWFVVLGSVICLLFGDWYFSEQKTSENAAVTKIEDAQQYNSIVTTPAASADPTFSQQKKVVPDGTETTSSGTSSPPFSEPRVGILPADRMGYSPAEVATLRKNLEQEHLQGYSEASEEAVRRIDDQVASGTLLPIADALPQLSFHPSQLQAGSPLWQQDKLLGIQPAGVFVEGEGWSGAASVHASKNTGNVLLVETVLGLGDSVEYPLETINSSVKGHAAVLTVEASPSGKALSSLKWTTNERDYALYVNGNANSKADLKTTLFELANALPLPYGSFQLPLANQ
jgi:hypothetical protein